MVTWARGHRVYRWGMLAYVHEYDCEGNRFGVRYLELERFANATIINGESTENVYEICSVYEVYDGIRYPTFFWGTQRMRKQCVPGPLLSS